MRSASAVFRKLKEAKFRRLVALYKNLFRKIPDNCKYNYQYDFVGSDDKLYSIKLCLIHHQNFIDLQQNTHLIDVCQNEEDCKNCNGFIPKYSREEIKEIFDNELKTKSIKESKYPEICALEWVLERYETGHPPLSWFQALYFKIKNVILKGLI
jgi:hypothetical protein